MNCKAMVTGSKLSKGKPDFLGLNEGLALNVADIWVGQLVVEELVAIF